MTKNPLHTEFVYTPAIPYEAGITRRDPSPVIKADGHYHVWYSKATADPSGYFASVWHATSIDGLTWTEQAEAISTGTGNAWDSNGCFTPSTLIDGGRYYLFYTAVPKPFDNDNGGPSGTSTAIGVAMADHPDGPWRKLDQNPVLLPGDEPDAPDGHRIDDACLIVREGAYWLYYKGRGRGKTPSQTVTCLAIANSAEGPYEKVDQPVLDSGHEVCVWPHRDGVAALVSPTGPQGSSVHYSEDGIRFELRSHVSPPSAPGPFRVDGYQPGWGEGITWGLCHDNRSTDRPFLLRFDCNLRADG
jgi:predicted GH43/DUF377 family glycosyl hydrolase